ncbi:MAG: leucine-rich repeat domain-containing protein [Mycoplasmataceae bacterium]|nr:leucine-rich repeat domain-containing protein [Mycoplasmataceae bacterium]
MSRSSKTIAKFAWFNIFIIIAGAITCSIPFLLSLLGSINNNHDKKYILIDGKSIVEAKTGLEDDEQYTAFDINNDSEELSDCTWSVAKKSGQEGINVQIENGLLNYTFNNIGTAIYTITCSKQDYTSSTLDVRFNISEQTISIEASDASNPNIIDIPLNAYSQKEFVAKFDNQILSDCTWNYVNIVTSTTVTGLTLDPIDGILTWDSSFSNTIKVINIKITCAKVGYTTGELIVAITVSNELTIYGSSTIETNETSICDDNSFLYVAKCFGQDMQDVTWTIFENPDSLAGITIDSSTGALNWTASTTSSDNIGSHTITIKCTKTDYVEATKQITFVVNAKQIVITGQTNGDNISIDQWTSGFKKYVSTCGGNTLTGVTWSITNYDGLDGKITINSSNGTFNYDDTITNGSYYITIGCTKTDYLDGSLTFILHVKSMQIEISGSTTIIVNQHDAGTEAYTATCEANATLSGAVWSVVDNAGLIGFSINSSSGVITWTDSASYTVGNYNISIKCTKAPYIVGTYNILFKVVFNLPNSYFIGLDDTIFSLPYSNDATTPGTSLYALCNYDYHNTCFSFGSFQGKLKGIHFGSDWDALTTAPANFCRYLFYDSTLTSIDAVDFPKNITTAGAYSLYAMFYQCTNLQTLPSEFNIPQVISNLPDHYCFRMFEDCSSLQTLPSGFTLMKNKNISTIGEECFDSMFEDCSSLQTLPIGFGMPISASSATRFAAQMFYGCTILQPLDDYDYEAPCFLKIPMLSGVSNCHWMFNNCIALQSYWSQLSSSQGSPSSGQHIGILRN